MIYSNRTGRIAEDTIGTGCFQDRKDHNGFRDCYRIGVKVFPSQFEHVHLDAFDRNVLEAIYHTGDAFPYWSGVVPPEIRLRARVVALASTGLSANRIVRQLQGLGPPGLTGYARQVSREQVKRILGAFRYAQTRGMDAYACLQDSTRQVPPYFIRPSREERWRGIDVSSGSWVGIILADDLPKKPKRMRRKEPANESESIRVRPITKEDCERRVKLCATREQFRRKHGRYYHWARRWGWLGDLVGHLPTATAEQQADRAERRRAKLLLRKDECAAAAWRYQTRSEFHKHAFRCYMVAREIGCFDEITRHMPTRAPYKLRSKRPSS